MFSPYLVPHLLPLFAIIALTFFVFFVTAYRRLTNAPRYPRGYFKLMRAPASDAPAPTPHFEVPAAAEQASRNLINLFEMPVLFYVATLLLLEVRMQNDTTLLLSWGFVLGRFVHSGIHLYPNKVIPRMLSYFVSSLFLLVLWITIAVRIVLAA